MTDQFSEAADREIERHKYYLSLERGHDVGYEAAKEDWLENYAAQWESQRQVSMLDLERGEIAKHQWIESEKAHKDLGRSAALDWVIRYAAQWRAWYDSEYEKSQA
jgi:hypothetical protein